MNKLYGLLGEKLGHSFSSIIHKKLFEELQMDANYQLFEVEQLKLGKAVEGLEALGAVGVNVTIPYKCDVVKYLDELSPEVKKIGAVNTIKFAKNKKIGYNTDCHGFKKMLEKYNIGICKRNFTILGSGGASDAVLQSLEDEGAGNIVIVTRDVARAQLKYKGRNAIIIRYNQINEIWEKDIIINCTPVGMYPHIEELPIEVDVLKSYNVAIDLIYNPELTLFLKSAQNWGAKTVNGLYMLVAQAVRAEEIWNDVKISDETVDKVYDYLKGYL